MSKFDRKLKRMFAPRVRPAAPNEPRVFLADDVLESSKDSAAQTPSQPPPVASEPRQDSAIIAKLRRSQELQRRHRQASETKTTYRMRSEAPGPSPTATPPVAHGSIGERLRDLRIQATALIDAGRTETALPLLHEMVSLTPQNPYPLEQLAKHYQAIGAPEFAELYAARLKGVSPF